MLKGHGGDIRSSAERLGVKEEDILDLSSNVNVPFTVGLLRDCAMKAARRAHLYPDPEYRGLTSALAEKYGLEPGNVLPGNGSTELLYLFFRALDFKKVLVLSPSYADYADAAGNAGAKVDRFFFRERDGFVPEHEELSRKISGYPCVVAGNPNNPTGTLLKADYFRKLTRANPKTFFLIDEAFIDFAPEESLLSALPRNAAVLRSLTKFYGLAGVRLGFIAASPAVIKRLKKLKEPWTINGMAEQAGMAVCRGKVDEAGEMKKNRDRLSSLVKGLRGIDGLKVFPSSANFILVKTGPGLPSAPELKERLLVKHKILIRDCSNFPGLSKRFFRVAVKGGSPNRRLLKALRDVLS